MNTRTINTAFATITILLLTSLAFAAPGKGMNADRPMRQNAAVAQLSQEKQDLLRTILDEHRQEVRPLKNAMWEKRTLLRALTNNSNTSAETITALVKDMGTLRTQLQDKHDALEARVLKEVGIELPGHFGRSGRGHGKMHNRDGRGMDQRGACTNMGDGNGMRGGNDFDMTPANGPMHLGRGAQADCPAI